MGKALAGFVTALYDESHALGEKVSQRFGVQAFPTLLVLDADGNEVDEVWGRDPGEFVTELERIRRGEKTLLSLRQRIAENPADVEAIADLAQRISMRRPEEADAIALAALAQVKPDAKETTAELLLVRAGILGNQEKHDEAFDLFERILDEYADTEAATNAGLEIANQVYGGDPERALALLMRALPLVDAEYRDHLVGTRLFLHQAVTKKLIRQQVKLAWDEGEWLNMIAWECYERGWLVTEALEWARRAVELTDRAPHVLDTLACLLFKADEVDGAIKVQAEALLRVEDESMRAEFEERMAMFYAVKRARETRGAR